MGAALKAYERSSYVLSYEGLLPDGRWPERSRSIRKHIFEQCEASLKRLGVEYIDLYFCHRYDIHTPLEETLRALDDLPPKAKFFTPLSASGAVPKLPKQLALPNVCA